MKVAAIDIETNLAHDKIWCVSVTDCETHEVIGTATSPQGMWSMISGFDALVAHNGMTFDFPVIERVWKVSLSPWVLHDTLVMSRLWYADIDGGHSLAAWGDRLGVAKAGFEVEDFDAGYTEEMREYCEQDTVVLAKLYHFLSTNLDKEGWSQESVNLEHVVAAITGEQVRNGFLLDQDLATQLWRDARRRQMHISDELQEVFPPIITERYSDKTGKRLKDKVEVFNVGSRQQIAKRLQAKGAVFTRRTEKGNVIVDEPALRDNDHIYEAQLCLEYLTLGKKAAMVDGWLKAVEDDGRVHGYVNTLGAVTRRMTHSKPNMAQVDSAEDMRSCWTVEDGNVLVGCDASGLELRMLANRINNPDFTEEVVNGDIHTRNQIAAGLDTRPQAKTFIYAFLYGAGDAKVGSVVNGTAKDGKRLKQQFIDATPGLQELRDSLRDVSMVRSLDGGMIRVRHQHAALNTMLQGDGAVLMKEALRQWYVRLKMRGVPFKLVANVHDEWQVECAADDADTVGQAMVDGLEQAGEILCPNVPITGEYKIGKTWAETH